MPVFHKSISKSLSGAPVQKVLIDLSSVRPLCRYRLLVCEDFLKRDTICIDSFAQDKFPQVRYAALSYVWHGLPATSDKEETWITVEGANHADPIGVKVLRHACKTAFDHGCTHLWMDRLCILQTNREDKDWQIEHMFKVYASCALCIVLAAGTQRLGALHEDTTWINRGWTLQEVLAPRRSRVFVLFSWCLGNGRAVTGAIQPYQANVQDVVPQESAIIPLTFLLRACATGYMVFARRRTHLHDEPVTIRVSVFADKQRSDSPNGLNPNICALALAMSIWLGAENEAGTKGKPPDRPPIAEFGIWQSAFMRSSSRPVDMVFSIMGLFGVRLKVSGFARDDRIGATKALVYSIMARGGRASWLGISLYVHPSTRFSTFPEFPTTEVKSKARLPTSSGWQEVDHVTVCEYPFSVYLENDMPKGHMDSDGYMHVSMRSIPIERVARSGEGQNHFKSPDYIHGVDGSTWRVRGSSDTPKTRLGFAYAVLINRFVMHSFSTSLGRPIRGLLLEPHQSRHGVRHHVRTYIFLDDEHWDWVMTWRSRKLVIGDETPDGNSQSSNHSSVVYESALEGTKQRMRKSKNWSRLNDHSSDLESKALSHREAASIMERRRHDGHRLALEDLKGMSRKELLKILKVDLGYLPTFNLLSDDDLANLILDHKAMEVLHPVNPWHTFARRKEMAAWSSVVKKGARGNK